MKKTFEQGRTLLELLGVLAVICLFGIFGVSLFQEANEKQEANSTFEEMRLMYSSLVNKGTLRTEKGMADAIFSNYNQENLITRSGKIFKKIDECPAGHFTLGVDGIDQDTCAELMRKNWKNVSGGEDAPNFFWAANLDGVCNNNVLGGIALQSDTDCYGDGILSKGAFALVAKKQHVNLEATNCAGCFRNGHCFENGATVDSRACLKCDNGTIVQDTDRICGSKCCGAEEECVAGACCNSSQVCGENCCEAGANCVNNTTCCAGDGTTGALCDSNDCCASGNCSEGHCCAQGGLWNGSACVTCAANERWDSTLGACTTTCYNNRGLQPGYFCNVVPSGCSAGSGTITALPATIPTITSNGFTYYTSSNTMYFDGAYYYCEAVGKKLGELVHIGDAKESNGAICDEMIHEDEDPVDCDYCGECRGWSASSEYFTKNGFLGESELNQTNYLCNVGVIGSSGWVRAVNRGSDMSKALCESDGIDLCSNISCHNYEECDTTTGACYCPAGHIGVGCTTECAAGTYAAQGATSCSITPAGSYSVAGSATYQECPRGTFSSSAGSASCSSCNNSIASSTTLYTGSTSPSDCMCDAGWTLNTTGLKCVKCSGGTAKGSIGNGPCTECVAGTAAAAGASVCYNCNAGKYSAAHASTCTNCTTWRANTTTLGAGMGTSTDDCLCKKGYKLSGDACVECEIGTYKAEVSNATTCTSCNDFRANSTTTVTARTATSHCYCDKGYRYSGGACVPCQAGKYKNAVSNSSSCTTCPANSTSEAGATVCSCNADYYMDNNTCVACPSGKTSPAGSTSSSDCVAAQASCSDNSQCTESNTFCNSSGTCETKTYRGNWGNVSKETMTYAAAVRFCANGGGYYSGLYSSSDVDGKCTCSGVSAFNDKTNIWQELFGVKAAYAVKPGGGGGSTPTCSSYRTEQVGFWCVPDGFWTSDGKICTGANGTMSCSSADASDLAYAVCDPT